MQRVYRGRLGRHQRDAKLAELAERRRKAGSATRIASMFRGFVTRLHDVDVAGAFFRMYQVRPLARTLPGFPHSSFVCSSV